MQSNLNKLPEGSVNSEDFENVKCEGKRKKETENITIRRIFMQLEEIYFVLLLFIIILLGWIRHETLNNQTFDISSDFVCYSFLFSF